MKRPRCKTCRHTMRGHKKRKCSSECVIIFSDGRSYLGSAHDNVPSGNGTMTFPNGDSYVGAFLDGEFHGDGQKVGLMIGIYKGQWHNGVRRGVGRWALPNGETYEGEFDRDMYHGAGVLTVSGSVRYRGQWNYGTFHGQGRLFTEHGDYNGQFSHHRRHGFGEQKNTQEHSVYTGGWRNDARHGSGVYTDPTGTYTGAFSSDRRNGHGEFVAKDGATYIGSWKNDKRHRRGTQTYADGGKYNGGWSRDVRTGHGKMTYADNTVYTGFWLYDMYHSRGTLITDSIMYKGEWEEGVLVGMVVEINQDTQSSWSSRSGPWSRGQRHGVFDLVLTDGNVERELWIHGKCVEYSGTEQARKRTRKYLKKSDWRAAEVICKFYPDIPTWNFLYRYDTDGRLVHMLEHDNLMGSLSQKARCLFFKGRYDYLEACVACCTEQELERLASHDEAGILFDSITKVFVANPWIVNQASYTEATKDKLLEGLHLGELGRCPPVDPFTRQPLNEKSGVYLSERRKLAKRIYKAFMQALVDDTPITRLAYHFDLQDFERDLANARAVNDVKTIRRLMKERNDFIALSNGR